MSVLAGVGAVPSEPADSGDFAEWVSPHRRAMSWLVQRMAPAVDAEDVVQEAVLRAWVKCGQFDSSRGTARSWLCAIAADQARKAARKVRSLSPMNGELLAVGDADVDQRIDLERAVAALPPRQRMAVNCFYFVGLSVADCAVVMRCSVGTVKSTLAAARERLRTTLEEEEQWT